MPISPELKKKLQEEGISGISDPNGKIRIYCETEEDVKKILTEMPEVKIAGVSYKVEAVLSGRFYALQARTSRWRPAPGGVSIGHPKVTAGTLGCVIRDKLTGKRVILSNNHILAASNQGKIGDPIYQPGVYDGGTEADTIAKLLRFVEIKRPPETNLVDAALAEPLSDDLVSDDILDIGKIVGIGEAVEGMVVKKSGRTTEVTSGKVFDTKATIKVYGYPWEEEYAIFEDQIIVMPAIAKGGDSGSACLDENNRLVGLLFAGSDEFTAFNKISNVMNLLDLEMPKAIPLGLPLLLGLTVLPGVYLWTKKR